MQSGALTYNGQMQSPVWQNYDSSKMTIGGVTSSVNAGNFTATFVPKNGYSWEDGTREEFTVTWTINKAIISSVPSQSKTLSYTGSKQVPTWTGFDSAKMTISGVTESTNAGTFNAKFTPTANYKWSDGTIDAKTVQWKINKIAGSMSINVSSVSVDISSKNAYVDVTRLGDGRITATSNNLDIATVSVYRSRIIITGEKTGSATITISVASGTNHLAPSSKTVSVTSTMPSKVLSENTPEVIAATVRAGEAKNYWSIGDTIPITVKGTVGGFVFNGTYNAFIIGFDHNSGIEGKNSIHFQFGKDSGGKDIMFVDNNYMNGNLKTGFIMHPTNSGSIGWSNCYMRKTICAQFYNALPANWKNIISECTKYTDNIGNGTNTSGNVTTTVDKIFLLSEFETFGETYISNSEEANHQKQYDYYKKNMTIQGWSKSIPPKYIFNNIDESGMSYHRSPNVTYAGAFCTCADEGQMGIGSPADNSWGFTPAFKIS